MLDHRTAPYAALVLRLSLAFFFIAHVYRKFAIIGFDNWWNRLAKDGYADWMLSYTLAAESAGAILLLLVAQVLLGDGAYALRVPALPWERGPALSSPRTT